MDLSESGLVNGTRLATVKSPLSTGRRAPGFTCAVRQEQGGYAEFDL